MTQLTDSAQEGLLELAKGVVSGLSYSMRHEIIRHVGMDSTATPRFQGVFVHHGTRMALRRRGLFDPAAEAWNRAELSPLGRVVWELVLIEELLEARKLAEEFWQDWNAEATDHRETKAALYDATGERR